MNELKHTRLPLNFAATFKPERRYINELLNFAKIIGKGSFKTIEEKTTIPSGTSTGKIIPTYRYTTAMGLIKENNAPNTTIKNLYLSTFGEKVYIDDPFLKQPVTQWICHFNLCRANGGAELWHHVFIKSNKILGGNFERETLDELIKNTYNVKNSARITGPLINMYKDQASFVTCNALIEMSNTIKISSAPIDESTIYGFGAWLLEQIEKDFPNQQQITLIDLDNKLELKATANWSEKTFLYFLDCLEQIGFISLDRHMSPWLLNSNISTKIAWNKIYQALF